MFSSRLRLNEVTQRIMKVFNTTKRNFKVMVAGAAGDVGQPLSLLLKKNSMITHLALYDVTTVTCGVAVDLSHMDTKTKVTAHIGQDQLIEAGRDADIIIMLAGTANNDPKAPVDVLFNANAPIVYSIISYVSELAPNAIIAVVTEPVNSIVPVVSEIMKRNRKYNPSKILGVTTLNVIRAATFVGQVNRTNPAHIYVPVIGGNSPYTIIPLLSQSKPPLNCDEARMKILTEKMNNAESQVAKAKLSRGSVTLSMAFAAARFTDSILKGLTGSVNVIECTYIKSNVTSAPYFATPVVLGKGGVEKNLGYGKLSRLEEKLLTVAVPLIWQDVRKGEDYVKLLDNKCSS